MTRFLLRILLLLLLPCAAFAQNTGKLAGRVVDDLGDPLPGANIIIDGTQFGAATDVDGNYFVLGIPAGQYNVMAAFVGFDPQTVEGIVISSGHTTEQNFELGTQYLGEIRVCFGCWGVPRDPFLSRVISGEEIERLPVER